jgi:hypothetical protein
MVHGAESIGGLAEQIDGNKYHMRLAMHCYYTSKDVTNFIDPFEMALRIAKFEFDQNQSKSKGTWSALEEATRLKFLNDWKAKRIENLRLKNACTDQENGNTASESSRKPELDVQVQEEMQNLITWQSIENQTCDILRQYPCLWSSIQVHSHCGAHKPVSKARQQCVVTESESDKRLWIDAAGYGFNR